MSSQQRRGKERRSSMGEASRQPHEQVWLRCPIPSLLPFHGPAGLHGPPHPSFGLAFYFFDLVSGSLKCLALRSLGVLIVLGASIYISHFIFSITGSFPFFFSIANSIFSYIFFSCLALKLLWY